MTTETIASTVVPSATSTFAAHPRPRTFVRDRGMLVMQYGMAITAIVVAVLLAGAR
jgi:hypothetical protein